MTKEERNKSLCRGCREGMHFNHETGLHYVDGFAVMGCKALLEKEFWTMKRNSEKAAAAVLTYVKVLVEHKGDVIPKYNTRNLRRVVEDIILHYTNLEKQK